MTRKLRLTVIVESYSDSLGDAMITSTQRQVLDDDYSVVGRAADMAKTARAAVRKETSAYIQRHGGLSGQ